ncbi:MAG: hypothetical protein JF603_02875 [Acidobacteria bacterium]|nr:hypothetical protein [Acidobacteriota bacterium]
MRRVIAIVLVALTLGACSSGGGAKGPSASVTVTTLSPVEREVEAAYLKSWDVYADAMLRLDTSRLSAVFDGAALRVKTAEVNDLRSAGHRGRMFVEHHVYGLEAGSGSAELHDDYLNHSVTLDATTREPTEPDPNQRIRRLYRLHQSGGVWKVVEVLSF